RDAVRGIEQAGGRVVVVGDRTLADLRAAMRTIGDTLGLGDAGDRLARDVDARLGAVHGRGADLPARGVLVAFRPRPRVVPRTGTLEDELVRLAGGTNVAADVGTVWPELSLEVVVARAPEVIVDAAMGSEQGPGELFAGLDTVPAVRDGRVVTLPSDAILRAG